MGRIIDYAYEFVSNHINNKLCCNEWRAKNKRKNFKCFFFLYFFKQIENSLLNDFVLFYLKT